MKRSRAAAHYLLLAHTCLMVASGADGPAAVGERRIERQAPGPAEAQASEPIGRGKLANPRQVVLPRLESGTLLELQSEFGPNWMGPTRSIRIEATSLPEAGDSDLVSGTWTTVGPEQAVWRATIRSSGARAMRVHFENVAINGLLYLYAHGSGPGAPFVGPYSGAGPQGDGDFWSELVFSDAVTIEYVTNNSESALQDVPFQVNEIAHIVREAFPFLRGSVKDSDNRYPGIRPKSIAGCHLDVSCYPEWADPRYKSVALLVIPKESGIGACTGTLINPRYDSEKYLLLLTAAHCIGNAEQAENTVFIWNYQTDECYGQPEVGTLRRSYGSTLVKTKGPDRYDDFTLLALDRSDVLSVTAVRKMGWNARAPRIGENVVNVSHPTGAFQRIAFGEVVRGTSRYLSSQGYGTLRWKRGTTEGGSSGSAIFDEEGRLIGIHNRSNNEEPCSDDYRGAFSKLSRVYEDIETFLESEAAVDKIADPRIELTLGASGESVTIRKTDTGGYTLNGEPFASGRTVAATNGNSYMLRLTTGGWTATYVAPPPTVVTLGISGSLLIHRRENGSYRARNTTIRNGSSFRAPNGNEYILNLDGRKWTATYKPLRVHVLLGSSNSSVTLERDETGVWWRQVQDGQLTVSSDRQVYRLVRKNGRWQAEPVTR